ncbi:MAG: spinster family MFS transporter [Steroidobacteraceae bacterium]
MTNAMLNSAAQGRDFGSPAYRRYVLLSLAFVYTLNFIDRALLGVLAQPVITTFGLSDAEFGFLAGPPFALFYALMGIPIALAADRYNRVAIIAICIALWSLMTALCGLATGFLFLLLARIGVAIGEAGSNPPSNSLIADYYRPDRRAKALSIYSIGVMLGSALAFLIGGPLGQLPDATVTKILGIFGLAWLPETFGWGSDFGWRFAFLALGVPGLLIAAIVWLTIREPPRGYSDPPGLAPTDRSGIGATLRSLRAKPSFWLMAAASSLVAMVGYGFASFQSPMMQRLHDLSPAEFALRFGVPLSVAGALGTIATGFITERLMRRSIRWLAWLPALSLVFAVPLYITAFIQPSDRLGFAFPIWMCASALHFSYLGAQYTIGQGVVPQSSRASAIAILLFIIALVGNGIGPQFVGALSDAFMMRSIEARGLTGVLDVAACHPKALGALTAAEQAVCVAIYGEGLRSSMIVTALLLLPAAVLFWLCAKRLDVELIAR